MHYQVSIVRSECEDFNQAAINHKTGVEHDKGFCPSQSVGL